MQLSGLVISAIAAFVVASESSSPTTLAVAAATPDALSIETAEGEEVLDDTYYQYINNQIIYQPEDNRQDNRKEDNRHQDNRKGGQYSDNRSDNRDQDNSGQDNRYQNHRSDHRQTDNKFQDHHRDNKFQDNRDNRFQDNHGQDNRQDNRQDNSRKKYQNQNQYNTNTGPFMMTVSKPGNNLDGQQLKVVSTQIQVSNQRYGEHFTFNLNNPSNMMANVGGDSRPSHIKVAPSGQLLVVAGTPSERDTWSYSGNTNQRIALWYNSGSGFFSCPNTNDPGNGGQVVYADMGQKPVCGRTATHFNLVGGSMKYQ